MTEPLVCAVMLTKDRPQMAKRAVECFRKQTYSNKRLVVGDSSFSETAGLRDAVRDTDGLYAFIGSAGGRLMTIGALRNGAIHSAVGAVAIKPDVLLHFDDDDYSHPNRIAEQVALLQASGKQCVGYRDMLFWNSLVTWGEIDNGPNPNGGQAWLYHNDDPRYCLGTSLCYWRKTWQERPFKDISRGEDKEFLRDRDTLGVCSCPSFGHTEIVPGQFLLDDPRMIASIHSGNHVVYEPEKSLPPPAGNWKRVPEWDNYCRERMAL